jgi:hypothetical protein
MTTPSPSDLHIACVALERMRAAAEDDGEACLDCAAESANADEWSHSAPGDLNAESTSNMKFRVSPELNDGDHWGILRTPQQVAEAVQAWANCCASDDPMPGDSFSVQVIAMSDAEYDALPEG